MTPSSIHRKTVRWLTPACSAADCGVNIAEPLKQLRQKTSGDAGGRVLIAQHSWLSMVVIVVRVFLLIFARQISGSVLDLKAQWVQISYCLEHGWRLKWARSLGFPRHRNFN